MLFHTGYGLSVDIRTVYLKLERHYLSIQPVVKLGAKFAGRGLQMDPSKQWHSGSETWQVLGDLLRLSILATALITPCLSNDYQ